MDSGIKAYIACADHRTRPCGIREPPLGIAKTRIPRPHTRVRIPKHGAESGTLVYIHVAVCT